MKLRHLLFQSLSVSIDEWGSRGALGAARQRTERKLLQGIAITVIIVQLLKHRKIRRIPVHGLKIADEHISVSAQLMTQPFGLALHGFYRPMRFPDKLPARKSGIVIKALSVRIRRSVEPAHGIRPCDYKAVEPSDAVGQHFIAAQPIRKASEAFILLFRPCVRIFYHAVHGFGTHERRLRLVRRSEARIQPHKVRIMPEHIAAEAVNGGDACASDIGRRIVKPQPDGLVPFHIRKLREPLLNALLHLGSSGVGERHDQKLTDARALSDEPGYALRHDRRLACSGSGGYQQIPFLGYSSFLFSSPAWHTLPPMKC